jgi:hypothetical protein
MFNYKFIYNECYNDANVHKIFQSQIDCCENEIKQMYRGIISG